MKTPARWRARPGRTAKLLSFPDIIAGSGARAQQLYVLDRHKRVSRMLGCTLTLGAAGDRLNFRTVASVRMTEAERAMLAYVALTALSPDASARIAAMAFEAAGEPSPAFLGGMADARDWASWATLAELKAHALPSGRRS